MDNYNVVLSVIVPVYQVEKYINKFLGTLIDNLIPGVEIIFIDDGSKDSCPVILDKFVQKCNSAYVYHIDNSGVGHARNMGLSYSKGRYIWFVDPDDYIAPKSFEIIKEALNKFNFPDLLIFDNVDVKDGIFKYIKSYYKTGAIARQELLRGFADEEYFRTALWNKILSKSIIENIKFSEKHSFAEDTEFLSKCLLNANTAAYIDNSVYFYCLHDSSLSTNVNEKDYIYRVKLTMNRYNIYKKIVPEISISPVVSAVYEICRRKWQGQYKIDIAVYIEFIKDNIKQILLDNKVEMNIKKQCLFVYIGIAELYNKLKSKQ